MTAFLNKISRFQLLITFLFVTVFSTISVAAEQPEDGGKFNASEVILHHVMDDHIWHLWDGHYGTIYLPVIVYSSDRGLDVFSSSRFYDENHQLIPYNGYRLEHNHIVNEQTGEAVLDLSITK